MPLPSLTKDAVGGEEPHSPVPGALTRGNLQTLTAAERRERAHRRGRSTPSPEPDTQAYRSERSWVTPPPIPAHERAYARLLPATLPDWPDIIVPNLESGLPGSAPECDLTNPADDNAAVTKFPRSGRRDDGDDPWRRL